MSHLREAMHSTLFDVARVLTEPEPREVRARLIAEQIRQVRGYRWVGIYDVTETEIRALAWTGDTAPADPRFPVTQGLNGAAVASRLPVVVQDVRTGPRSLTTFETTLSASIYPVLSSIDGRALGTIDVESDLAGVFGPFDSALLSRVAAALRPLWDEEPVRRLEHQRWAPRELSTPGEAGSVGASRWLRIPLLPPRHR